MNIVYIIGRIILTGLILYCVYLETGPFTTTALFLIAVGHDLTVRNIRILHKLSLTGRKS